MAGYNPFSAVQTGIDFTQGIFDRSANLASGRAAAQGNYGAAANAQFANGNIAGGAALQDRGTALDTAARARRTADGTAALGVYKQVTDALEGEVANGPQAVIAAFTRIRPVLERTGATAEQLDAYSQMLQQDPVAAIRTVRGAIGQAEWEFRDGGAGDVVAVRQGPGGRVESQVAYDAPDRPIATQFGIILPPNARPAGSTVGPATAASGAAPAMTGPAISGGPLWSRQEQQESGGRQSAVSPVGAFGVAQLMPETAADLARQMGVTPAQLRSDENLNRQAGQMYMDQQLAKYGGNEVLALAAYNAGPGRVDEWIQRIGDPRTGEITTEEFAAQIPFAETRNYVRNITGGNMGGGQQVDQGSDTGQELQDLGGGYTLQPMQSQADLRAARAEERANRSDQREQARFNQQMSGQPSASDARAERRILTQEQQRLNTEFNRLPVVQRFRSTEAEYADVRALARGRGGVNSVALTYAVMKMAAGDGSVVRESEFALVGQAAGIPEGTVALMQRAANGDALTAGQRRQIESVGDLLYHTRRAEYNREAERFRGFAAESGVNADRVAPVAWGPEGPPEQRRQRARTPLGFTPSAAQRSAAERLQLDDSAPEGSARNPVKFNPNDPRVSRGNLRTRRAGPDGYVYFLDENGRPGRVRPGAQ